jgi:hypothetical protein
MLYILTAIVAIAKLDPPTRVSDEETKGGQKK